MAKTEFFNVQPVGLALDMLLRLWQPRPPRQATDTRRALGRVLASAPPAPGDLPAFRRSAVDGYAVRAADTFGAGHALPAYLRCVGSIAMGAAATSDIQSGETLLIHTGGMLPASADAVVMVERTQPFGPDEIEVYAPVAPGENVVQIGEDIAAGAALVPPGQRLRPHDIGGLLAAGVMQVEVVAAPRVALLSSGDELIAPEAHPAPGQIRDINAPTLAALVEQAGGDPLLLGIARDHLDDFLPRARQGFARCDLLVISAGSSVSTRDLTVDVIAALGKPGILQHGLAVKPGKPTILALCDGKPVIGLPGNPVSAYLVARQILVPLLRHWLGQPPPLPATLRATLTHNVASVSGREDSVPVRLFQQDGAWLATPVFGKSNLIFTLVNANALLPIPLNSAGLKAGTVVEVEIL
ncbi:MAG: molybdopterin molybdenumtransferase MoeA [Chloroflexi bacterium]|nr:molybdopterin molybdenumtransferase MoeA [Chloroflexota bacterium]